LSVTKPKVFSSEADTGSREENTIKQGVTESFRFNLNRKDSKARATAWLDFWNGDTPIYANERHKRLHYQDIARDIAAHIPGSEALVLDYGCGEALSAQRVAEGCERLYLYDAAPFVRSKLSKRFRDAPRIEILEDGALAAIEDASLDLVVANSLIQYVRPEGLPALLALWRSKLKPGGRLLLSDIPAPSSGAALSDTLALLEFGWRGGFLVASLMSLARLYFSDYRRLRREYGFFAYEPGAIEELLRREGFSASRLPRNIGHNQGRFSFLASKVCGAGRSQDDK
jgi:SAM-dependent methyltransferase